MFLPSILIILAKACSAQKSSTSTSVVKNTKERKSVSKSTWANDKQKKPVAYLEAKPNKGSPGGSNSDIAEWTLVRIALFGKISEFMASPTTHMENSSFGVACIKNYGRDWPIRGLWIKKK